MLFVITLGTLSHVTTLMRARAQPNRGRHLLAQVVLLAFGIALLQMADSATSTACFILGAVIILVTGLRSIEKPACPECTCSVWRSFLGGGLTMLLGVHLLPRVPWVESRIFHWTNGYLGGRD